MSIQLVPITCCIQLFLNCTGIQGGTIVSLGKLEEEETPSMQPWGSPHHWLVNSFSGVAC